MDRHQLPAQLLVLQLGFVGLFFRQTGALFFQTSRLGRSLAFHTPLHYLGQIKFQRPAVLFVRAVPGNPPVKRLNRHPEK